jgi:hypothetical protein
MLIASLFLLLIFIMRYLLPIILTLTSCSLSLDSTSYAIMHNYEVMWVDVREQQCICERDGMFSASCSILVAEYVFSVGHDKNYIIAKQHPVVYPKPGADFKIDTSITNHFIININTKKVLGPFTQEEFIKQRKELKIEEIEFDMNYPEVP